MTLSLTAVFIPLLFLSGIIGRLFREFAVTIAIAILVSGLVSLTLTPMLASIFLRSPKGTKHGRMYNSVEHGYDWMLDRYKSTLAWTMERRPLMMLFSAVILIGTFLLFKLRPRGFIPTEDTWVRINISTQAAQGVSFQEMVQHQQQVANIVAHDTNVAHFMSSANGGNQGRLLLASLFARRPGLAADQPDQRAASQSLAHSRHRRVRTAAAGHPDRRPLWKSQASIEFTLQAATIDVRCFPRRSSCSPCCSSRRCCKTSPAIFSSVTLR